MAGTASAALARESAAQRHIGTWTLVRILWRSFFFQAATNYQRMQNVGFAFCILPALERLYEGEALKQAMARHLQFFNSQPYMANALLGAAVRLEQHVAAGKLRPEHVQSFKTCMMGPMAAIGDSFFWASLKPFAAALAIAGILSDVLWAPFVFLLLYNMFHLSLRIYGLWAGYRMGERVFEKLYQIDLVQFSDRSHYLTGICVGVGGALMALDTVHPTVALGTQLAPLLFVPLVLIFFQCIKRRMSLLVLLYGSGAICFAVILALNAVYPLL